MNGTDINLPLNVPSAIRLHGDVTQKLAAWRHKLALLIELRLIAGEPDPHESEALVAEAIRDYETMLADLEARLYPGGKREH